MGSFQIALDREHAPKSVDNFLDYVDAGHYTDTIFHRVIPGFMIQGGGFGTDYAKKPVNAPVPSEADNGLKNLRGTVAMARTSDPHSATSQFYINVADNAFLDHPGSDGWGYCVFGKVSDGMDVVDAIAGVSTGNTGGHQDVPVEPVKILEVTISK